MGSSILKMNRFGLLCLLFGLLTITCLQEASTKDSHKKPVLASTEQELDGDNRNFGSLQGMLRHPKRKCKDKYDEKKCIKIKEAGKCEDKKVVKKCIKTCEKCEDHGSEGGKCKDKMDKKKCTKMMEAGKCEDEKVAKKCMKTCNMCEDVGPKKTPFELIDENSDGNITRDEWQMKIKLAMDKVMHITNVTLDEDYENLYDDIWEALDCNNATAIDMEDWEMLLDGENQCGDKLDSWFHFAFNAVVSIIQIVCQKY